MAMAKYLEKEINFCPNCGAVKVIRPVGEPALFLADVVKHYKKKNSADVCIIGEWLKRFIGRKITTIKKMYAHGTKAPKLIKKKTRLFKKVLAYKAVCALCGSDISETNLEVYFNRKITSDGLLVLAHPNPEEDKTDADIAREIEDKQSEDKQSKTATDNQLNEA